MVLSTEAEVDSGTADTDVSCQDVQCLTAYLYADNGLIVTILLTHLQRVFTTLMDPSNHVGLYTNVSKTVSMACQPCRSFRGTMRRPMLSVWCGRVTPTGSGSTSGSSAPSATWNRWQGPWFTICSLTKGCPEDIEGTPPYTIVKVPGPTWYPPHGQHVTLIFPVEGFQGRASIQSALWVHFVHRHVRDIILLLE